MTTNLWFLQLPVMSFHIQFNNVSADNVTSPLIKKPEKDLRFKDVRRGIWKIVHTFFYKNIISKHHFSSSFIVKVFPLLKSKWLMFSIQEIKCFIHVHKVFIWIARSVEIFCRKWLSYQHQFNYVLIEMVYIFFQAEKENKWGKLVRVDQQKNARQTA